MRSASGLELPGLAQLYLGTQVDDQGQGATFRAKRDDLEKLLRFYFEHYGHYRAAEFYPATTRRFLRWLATTKKADGTAYAETTISRVYSTVRHFARWAHRERKCFPMGSPVEGVSPPKEPEPPWKGLREKDVDRLITAAHALRNRPKRSGATNQGTRDLALLHALLGSALRISELLSLEVSQYDGRRFLGVIVKGGHRRDRVPVHKKENREAIASWLSERGDNPGPLFCTRSGKPLLRRQAYGIIKRIEAQANAHLPEGERFTVSPHELRHTLGRELANDRGERFARKQLGHRSGRQLYRYIQPSDADLEDLFD